MKPVALTISPKPASVEYGFPMPKFGWTANFVNGDTPASLTAQPVCSTKAPVDHNGNEAGPAGKYAVTCSGAKDANYAISYMPSALTVLLSPVVISFVEPKTAVHGRSASFWAKLLSTRGTPVQGRRLEIKVGLGDHAQSCRTNGTGPKGKAFCAIGHLDVPKGSRPVVITFAGDAKGASYDYQPGRGTGTLTVK